MAMMDEEEDEMSYQKRIRREVARFVRLPIEKVEFLKRHTGYGPPVCSLEVEGKGPYFAMDVVLEFDEVQTFVVPMSEKIKTTRDVFRACRSFLIRTGRLIIEPDD